MKKAFYIVPVIFIFSFFISFHFSFAETDPLVKCGTERYDAGTYKDNVTNEITQSPTDINGNKNNDVSGQTSNPCGFKDLMKLVNSVINFILFVLALPLAAILFAYAGFMLVASGGNSERMSKAKNTFINVAIGLVIAAAAWLIIHTIFSILGFDGSWIGL